MNIAVSGATGFIGSALCEYLRLRGHQIFPLGRDLLTNGKELTEIIDKSEVIINLAGAPINRRWSRSYKKVLEESRIKTTNGIVTAINATSGEKLLISASAVGYYPSTGECFGDALQSPSGENFLASLCVKWESEANKTRRGVRCAITRFGIVMDPYGGAFPQMVKPAKAGMSVVIGNGRQSLPWIDRRDLIRAMEHIIINKELCGTFNFVAPQRLSQKNFAKITGKHYGVHLTVHIPAIFFKMILGEASQFITGGQCAVPEKLQKSGFEFTSPDLETFLANMYK
ncbi:MAG: TIGR01777 family oxidoreductase [Bacteroidales bacterium]|jgi:uncharacterized protein (TIGR01777 family)|nr:TIGR01777 family oxidoreductase [Bacteroidales bacterium]